MELDRVFARMMAGLVAEADVPRTVMLDATHLKAHRTASSLRTGRMYALLMPLQVPKYAHDGHAFSCPAAGVLMVRTPAAILLLVGSQVYAQEAVPADPLDILSRIEARACVTEGEATLILLRRAPAGLVTLGEWQDAQVLEAGGVLTLVRDQALLQIGPDASASVKNGVSTTVACARATDVLRTALAEVAADREAAAAALSQGSVMVREVAQLRAEGDGLSARLARALLQTEDLRARLEERDRLAQATSATAADLNAARAHLLDARRASACVDRMPGTLAIVLSFLEEGARVEMPPALRESYARLNAARIQSLLELCLDPF